MFIIDGIAFLITLFLISILFSFLALSLVGGFFGLAEEIGGLFSKLRNFLSGGSEETASVPRVIAAVLFSKLLAALILGGGFLYLGASVKVATYAAIFAFLFIG
jgi:hypothetical protein